MKFDQFIQIFKISEKHENGCFSASDWPIETRFQIWTLIWAQNRPTKRNWKYWKKYFFEIFILSTKMMKNGDFSKKFQISKNGQDRLNGHQKEIFDHFWWNFVKIWPEIENLVSGIWLTSAFSRFQISGFSKKIQISKNGQDR